MNASQSRLATTCLPGGTFSSFEQMKCIQVDLGFVLVYLWNGGVAKFLC